jgi:hypothetical protein
MKIQAKISEKIVAEIEGKDHKEIFEQLAGLQELFSDFNKCEKCGCSDIQLLVRSDNDGNKYYEMQCKKCWAKLSFGQNKGEKNGTLYPRRYETKDKNCMGGKLEAKAVLPNRGWLRYNRETKEIE